MLLVYIMYNYVKLYLSARVTMATLTKTSCYVLFFSNTEYCKMEQFQ